MIAMRAKAAAWLIGCVRRSTIRTLRRKPMPSNRSQRTVNRVNYRRAMDQGDRPIMSPELDRLMGSPAVVEAMRRASTSGKDRAITQGLGRDASGRDG
jgi:hypothetical protein